MRCPYCISEIPDEAVVCSVCRRDLSLIKPLLERIAGLEAQLATAPLSSVPVVEEVAGDAIAAPIAAPEVPQSYARALAFWFLPIVLLLLCDWLVIFVYDANVIYLRILALLLPLPFGFMFARRIGWVFVANLLPAAAMALLAVWSMSAITALIDHVPILPQNMVEVREFVEFSASIGLSFTTGLWLHSWWHRRMLVKARIIEGHRAVGGSALLHGQKITDSLTKVNDLASAVVAFATTAISIYTGLKGVLG